MRRLFRFLLNSLTVLSLLLCATVLVLWAWRVEASLGTWPWLVSFDDDGVELAHMPGNHDWWSWRAAYWKLTLLTLALPAARFLAAWRSHRRRKSVSLCAHCGYDLRATPDRCPECGAVPGPAGSADGRPGATRA